MEAQWPLILFTFFLCCAGGVFAMLGILNLMGKGKKLQLVTLIVGIACLGVGALCVFQHLQHWERIFNGFGHITSGITKEMIVCVIYAVIAVLYFLMMRRAEDGMAPKWCAVLAIIIGVAVPLVTGDSYLMESLPSWDTPMLLVYYFTNTVFLGGLMMMVIASAMKDTECFDVAWKVAAIGGVIQLVAVIVYAFVINSSVDLYSADIEYYFDPTLPDVAMVDREGIITSIVSGEYAVMFWLGTVVISDIVPTVMIVLTRKITGVKQIVLSSVELALCILGSFFWRYMLYMVAISLFALY